MIGQVFRRIYSNLKCYLNQQLNMSYLTLFNKNTLVSAFGFGTFGLLFVWFLSYLMVIRRHSFNQFKLQRGFPTILNFFFYNANLTEDWFWKIQLFFDPLKNFDLFQYFQVCWEHLRARCQKLSILIM